MRSESANRFADASVDVPFRACPYGSQPQPAIIQLEESRNLAAAHWVPGVGGVALISDEGGRYDHQQLFFVTPSGLAQPLALPGFLRSPVNEVLLVQRSQPLIVIGEAWWTGDERTRWLMEDVFGKPDHGDLVAMDFSGAQRARHRSAHWASLSPDFRWMAYWRSADDGLHNLFVTRPEEESARFVAAIVELDPGSGMSFSECWSADSRFLHVSGSAYGPRSVCWTYDLVVQELYSSDECSLAAIQKRKETL